MNVYLYQILLYDLWFNIISCHPNNQIITREFKIIIEMINVKCLVGVRHYYISALCVITYLILTTSPWGYFPPLIDEEAVAPGSKRHSWPCLAAKSQNCLLSILVPESMLLITILPLSVDMIIHVHIFANTELEDSSWWHNCYGIFSILWTTLWTFK